MTNNHVKTKIQPTPKTVCRPTSNIPQTMGNIQHNNSVI